MPRPLRLLHLRHRSGPRRVAVPVARRGAGHRPARRRGRLPRGAVHPGRAPRGPLSRRPARGSTTTATRPTVDYLAAVCGLVRGGDRAAPPRQRRRARRRRAGPAAAGVGLPGDDDRDAQPGPRLPPGGARQDAGAPPGHARGGRRAGHPVHHRHPRRHRREPRRPHRRPRGHRRQPPPPRPRAGGHRPELPAQAGHGHARQPGLPAGRVPLDRGRGPAAAARRGAPAGPAQPVRRLRRACSTPASTTGAASRLSPPTTSTPSGRGRRSTGCDAATEARGFALAPRLTDLPGVRRRPRALARSGHAHRRCSTGPTPRASAATTRRGSPAATPPRRAPAARRPAARARAARSSGVGPEVLRRRARLGQRGGRGRDRHPVRRPRAGGRRRGRGGRRAAPASGRRRRHLGRQPQHQLHQRLHVQVPVLRLLQGPAVAQPARRALPARPRRHPGAGSSRRSRRAPPRCACRAASIPASTATTTSTCAGR